MAELTDSRHGPIAHLESSRAIEAGRRGADRGVGKNVYYGANHSGKKAKREHVGEMTRALAPEVTEGSRDRTSLKLVLHKRQDKARKYFDELAGKFGRAMCPADHGRRLRIP